MLRFLTADFVPRLDQLPSCSGCLCSVSAINSAGLTGQSSEAGHARPDSSVDSFLPLACGTGAGGLGSWSGTWKGDLRIGSCPLVQGLCKLLQSCQLILFIFRNVITHSIISSSKCSLPGSSPRSGLSGPSREERKERWSFWELWNTTDVADVTGSWKSWERYIRPCLESFVEIVVGLSLVPEASTFLGSSPDSTHLTVPRLARGSQGWTIGHG